MKYRDKFIYDWQDNYIKNYEDGWFSHERTKPLMYLVNTRPYSRVPILLISAGPSLDRNIESIKKYKDRVIIICVDVVLFKLIENDITPDFVVNIDPSNSIKRFWDGVDTSKSILVCPTTTNTHTIESWNGNIFLFNQIDFKGTEKGVALKKIIESTRGYGNIQNRYFVGATALQFSYILNPSLILLAGYDFAFTDNKAYCDGFLERKLWTTQAAEGTEEHAAILDKLKSNEIKKEVEYTSTYGKVWTTRLLEIYKNTFSNMVLSSGVPTINCTEGGILNTIPCASLGDTIKDNCKDTINKINVFNYMPKRKRGRR